MSVPEYGRRVTYRSVHCKCSNASVMNMFVFSACDDAFRTVDVEKAEISARASPNPSGASRRDIDSMIDDVQFTCMTL